MSTMTYLQLCVCLLAFSGLSACTLTSTHIKNNKISDIQPILKAYRETIRQAHTDTEYSWNNGRLGNILVNLDNDTRRGLCFHWQKKVYIGIQPALATSTWKATGIAINEGSFFEHHAVLVYNPSKIHPRNILENIKISSVYVLDPWSSGEARVYTLNNWLQLPLTIIKPARLTSISTKPVYPPSL